MKFLRERGFIEAVWERPSDPGGRRELEIFADGPDGEVETVGNLALREPGIVSESQDQ